MFETDYALTLRAAAPLDTVWDELHTLERLLENVQTISSFEIEADGRHASFTGALTRWPASWRSLPGQAEITSTERPRRLGLTLTVPEVALQFVGTFELDPVAAEETNITYRGELHCEHPLAARLRHVLTGILETHMDALVTRIASRAARRTAAAHALGDL